MAFVIAEATSNSQHGMSSLGHRLENCLETVSEMFLDSRCSVFGDRVSRWGACAPPCHKNGDQQQGRQQAADLTEICELPEGSERAIRSDQQRAVSNDGRRRTECDCTTGFREG